MAGIYLHIPYCRSNCHYCDFYATSNMSSIEKLVESEKRELIARKQYIGNEIVETIYFGGGTPSVLSAFQVKALLEVINANFIVALDCEITLEANPEDLAEPYLTALRLAGINRMSIGIQSFNNEMLSYLGRGHDNSKLVNKIRAVQKAGIGNISIDLIYGIPGLSLDNYSDSLKEAMNLGIQHISAYSLIIEKNTFFYNLYKTNRLKEAPDDDVVAQFNMTIDTLASFGFSHYEVSSFALEGFKSRHNSSYWEGKKYLGVGPSAHSFDGISRQWNVSSIKNYILNIEGDKNYFEIEILSEVDRYNEYLLVGLRTAKGISKHYVSEQFNSKINSYFLKELSKLNSEEFISVVDDRVKLTRKGIFVSDLIIRTLFFS